MKCLCWSKLWCFFSITLKLIDISVSHPQNESLINYVLWSMLNYMPPNLLVTFFRFFDSCAINQIVIVFLRTPDTFTRDREKKQCQAWNIVPKKFSCKSYKSKTMEWKWRQSNSNLLLSEHRHWLNLLYSFSFLRSMACCEFFFFRAHANNRAKENQQMTTDWKQTFSKLN